MERNEKFEAEWRILKERGQSLSKSVGQLEVNLRNLSCDPEVKKLLEEKTALKKQAKEVEKAIDECERLVRIRVSRLEQRHLALTDEKIRMDLAKRATLAKHRIYELKKMNAPGAIIQNDQTTVWEIEAPIDQVQADFYVKNAQTQEEKQYLQHCLKLTRERIASIETHYLKLRKCLEEGIRAIECKAKRHQAEQLEWATSDRSHLEWILENEPWYRTDVIAHYKVRFPEDDLSDLVAQPTYTCAPGQNGFRGKKKRICPDVQVPPEITTKNIQPETWNFWIAFSVSDKGQELPEDYGQHLQFLAHVLNEAGFNNLRANLVYNELNRFVGLSRQQRRKAKKVCAGPLKGLTTLKVQRKSYRLFLWIDEENHRIKFLPRPRETAYKPW